MSTLIADIRYSFRSLLKNPGLTLAAILSLGLGIGANTTIFTWVQAVLFRPIPLAADPSSIRIAAMENREGQSRSWSYPNFVDFRDRATMLDVVAQDDQTFSIAVDDTAERAWGALVSGNYFEVMGIRPAAGRFFTAKDDVTPGGHPVAVLSYANWQRRFAGDPAVVGKQVTINNTPITIIGVAPEGFIGSFLGVVAGGVGADGDAEGNDGRRSHEPARQRLVPVDRPAEARRLAGAGAGRSVVDHGAARAGVSRRQRRPPAAHRADVGGAVRRRAPCSRRSSPCCRCWSRSCS